MNSLEMKLATKISTQQDLEDEIKDAQFRLEYTKYEISSIKDAIISEYEERIEEKLQQIEELQEATH